MDTDFWDEAKPMCEKRLTVDMWDGNGPGSRYNGSQACSQTNQAGCTYFRPTHRHYFINLSPNLASIAEPALPFP